MFTTYLYCLKHLEASIDPNVDDRINRGCHSIKSICDHQEMVRSDCEELPVVRPWGPQHLVDLKRLCQPVPYVYHTVYGVICITWKSHQKESKWNRVVCACHPKICLSKQEVIWWMFSCYLVCDWLQRDRFVYWFEMPPSPVHNESAESGTAQIVFSFCSTCKSQKSHSLFVCACLALLQN